MTVAGFAKNTLQMPVDQAGKVVTGSAPAEPSGTGGTGNTPATTAMSAAPATNHGSRPAVVTSSLVFSNCNPEQILAAIERLKVLWLKQASTQLSVTEFQELAGLLAQIEPAVQSLEQLYAALTEERNTLPIVDVGTISPARSPETPLPVLVIDPTGRPELLDVGRVINQEKPGAMQVRWSATLTPPAAQVVLRIDVATPVAFSLKLRFHLPRESGLLESIIEAPALAITPYPLRGVERTVEPRSVIVVTCPDEYDVVRAALDQVDMWNGG